MDLQHVDNSLEATPYTRFGTPLGKNGEYGLRQPDNFPFPNELYQFGDMGDSYFFSTGQSGTMMPLHEFNMFQDREASPVDQPATSASTDSERSANPDTKMRRRAQNRASQRAFRERKEKHLRSLKSTLGGLTEKHQKLLESYSQQSNVVMKLKGRIAELNAELKAFSIYSDRDMNNFGFESPAFYSPAFDKFDAFPHTARPFSDEQTEFHQSQPLSQSQLDSSDLPELVSLPSFEDLLSLP